MYTLLITSKGGEVQHVSQEVEGTVYYHPEEQKFQVLVQDESRTVQILIPAEAIYDIVTEQIKKSFEVIKEK